MGEDVYYQTGTTDLQVLYTCMYGVVLDIASLTEICMRLYRSQYAILLNKRPLVLLLYRLGPSDLAKPAAIQVE